MAIRKTGQLIEREKGIWTIRIYLGEDSNGKRQYHNETYKGTKKDAQKQLTKVLSEKDSGVYVRASAMSLNEFLDKWLAESAALKIRERTLNGYKSLLNCHVRNKLGAKRLSNIQVLEVQKLYNEMNKANFSPKTIRHVHNVLASALKQAVKWKMLTQNPCDFCDLPRQVKTEMQCFTPDEAKIFLEAAKDDKYYALFFLAIETGMRPEEYLGLQWKDIDFDNRVLSVRRAVVVRKGGGFIFTEPKTKKSRRQIPLSNSLITALKDHRRKQLEERLKIGGGYHNLDLVFSSEIGTPLLHQNLTRRHFKPIRDNAGKYQLSEDLTKDVCPSCSQKTFTPYVDKDTGETISLELGRCDREKDCGYHKKPKGLPKIRLYDLRHTTATLLLSAGLNPKIVSERLGHASIVLTLDTYSHVLPTMQREATDELEAIFLRKSGTK